MGLRRLLCVEVQETSLDAKSIPSAHESHLVRKVSSAENAVQQIVDAEVAAQG
jgi:hypothetical protein